MITSPIVEKIRRINKIIQKTGSYHVDFMELADVLKSIINANIYIIDHTGAILGYGLVEEFECEIMLTQVIKKGGFPQRYNNFLLRNEEPGVNLRQKSDECVFLELEKCLFRNKVVTVIPVMGSGRRLGTLLLARFTEMFEADDVVLAEIGATVVGMEILRARTEKIEEEARSKAIIQVALGTLSYSEFEALECIFSELDGDEGLLVASKIADQLGITRSVIVNALRKMESAGIIESRSLGMKGTYIKILNGCLFDYLGREQRNSRK